MNAENSGARCSDEGDFEAIAITKRQYQELVKSVAFIEREARSEIAERDHRSNGGEVLYVLDSNVLRSHGAPYRHGRKTRGGYGLGQFLPRRYSPRHSLEGEELRRLVAMTNQEEDRTAGNLLSALTECVKKRIENQGEDIVQLTAHRLESINHHKILIDRTGATTSGQEEVERRAILIEKIASTTLERYMKASQNGEAKPLPPEIYIENAQKLFARAEEINDINPAAELHRFSQFLGRMGTKFDGKDILDCTDPIPNREEYKVARHLLRKTFEDLIPSTERKTRIQRDQDALVQLALLNKVQHEDRHYHNGYSKRIVLITCSKELSNAAFRAHDHLRSNLQEFLKTFPGAGSGIELAEFLRSASLAMERFFSFGEKAEKEERWFKAFGLHSVRHISGFLGDLTEASILRKSNEKAKRPECANEKRTRPESITLFSGLFAEQTKTVKLPTRALNEIIDKPESNIDFPRRFPSEFIQLHKKWKLFVQQALGSTDIQKTNYRSESSLKYALRSALVRGASSGDAEPTELTNLLSEFVDRARDRMVLQFSHHGAELSRMAGETSRRTSPDLYFRNLNASFSMFRKMSVKKDYPGSKEWREDYGKIRNEDCDPNTDDDRWESHLKFLVLAASFSCLEKWSVASGHLEKAINIVDRTADRQLPEITTREVNNPSGREASFLQSVCERMLASDVSGLDRASEALKKSEDCSQDDTVADSSRGSSAPRSLSTLRYYNEKLSIALSRYYLRRMEDCNGTSVNMVGECSTREWHDKCRDQIANLKECFKKLTDHEDFDLKNVTTASIGGPDTRGQMLGITLISAATNIVQLAVIDRYWTQGGLPGLFATEDSQRESVGLKTFLTQALQYLNAARNSEPQTERAIEARLTLIYRRVASTMLASGDVSAELAASLDPIDREEREKLFGFYRSNDISKIDRWRFESVYAFVKNLHEEPESAEGSGD